MKQEKNVPSAVPARARPVRAKFAGFSPGVRFRSAHRAVFGYRRRAVDVLADVAAAYSFFPVGYRYDQALEGLATGSVARSVLFALHYSRTSRSPDLHAANLILKDWKKSATEVADRAEQLIPLAPGTRRLIDKTRLLLAALADPRSTAWEKGHAEALEAKRKERKRLSAKTARRRAAGR